MKKNIILAGVMTLFLLTACAQNNVTGKNMQDSANDYVESESSKTIKDKETSPKEQKELTEIKINETTKNMNTATIKTNIGLIKVKLNSEKAPETVENFKKYANSGFFSGTIFHRVIPGFMIQGGGFDGKGQEKATEEPIKIESDNGLENKRGTIAMARTMVPDSATSQFFINLVDNDFLNFRSYDTQGYGYAVFGEVTEGMDVVDEIAKAKTGANGPHQDWPKENIVIESVTLSE